MRNRSPAALVAVLVALAFGGCSCEDPVTRELVGVPAADKTALNYGEVCSESLQHQTFTLSNSTSGVLTAALSVTGDGAEFFSVDPANVTLRGTGASQQITVTYQPTGDVLGDRHTANVEVAYTGEGNKPAVLSIEVSGEVATTSVAPKVSMACGTDAGGEPLPRCNQGGLEACCSTYDAGDGTFRFEALSFGQPRVGDTATLPLRIENLGCGNLEVSSITLTTQASMCGDDVISTTGMDESPIIIPGGLGGGEGHDFSLSFTPDSDCTYAGSVTVNTTDDRGEPIAIASTVLGTGRDAKLVVSRNQLYFGEVTPGTTSDMEFAIRNSGTVPINVTSVQIKNDKANTLDFSILKMEKDACNGNTPSGNRTEVTIGSGYTFAGTDAKPNCGDDEVFVTVRYTPGSPADQDRAHFEIVSDEGALNKPTLQGGTDPVIGSDPDMVSFGMPANLCNGGDQYSCSRIDNQCTTVCSNDADCGAGGTCYGAEGNTPGTCFGDDACAVTCGTSTNTVRITNSGFAELVIGTPYITDTSHGDPPQDPNGWDLFEVGANNCTGNPVAKDEYCEIEVRFRDKNTGGFSDAYLKVPSNDPLYEETPYFVQLRAVTKVDNAPTATFVSSPDLPRKESWVRLDALNSTDDRGIAGYRWELISAASDASFLNGLEGPIDPANPNANCPAHYNGGECIRFPVAGSTRVIEFRPDIAGFFEWRLIVTDTGCDPAHETKFNQAISISN
ncbi:choice-of-anchor D domain-containing protein [Vulgatibacter sp.]|uniref:choice-of-anchor D domain-containing protein n=1 Tax=Vulgatibacter sp. TaxID=1971226 RepID=UPI003563D47E